MIVITGPGRSGTSLIASIYKQLGYDPGGAYAREVSAGYEDRDVVSVNRELMRDLKVSAFRIPGVRGRIARYGPKLGKPRGIDWRRFDRVVERHKASLREISEVRTVVKDPHLSWMLPVWIAAGATIDYVIVAMRSPGAMADSRSRSSLTHFRTSETRNSILYGLGVLIGTLYESNVPHSIVRFEEWVQNPAVLFEAARFPEMVGYEEFAHAFETCVDRRRIVYGDSKGLGVCAEGWGE